MVFFYKKILLSKRFEDHKGIFKSLNDGELPVNSFLICINRNSTNLMDIYFSGEIHKPYIKTDGLLLIAVCKDKNDAKNTCVKIISDFLGENKDLDEFKNTFFYSNTR